MSIALQYHWSRLNPAILPLSHRGSSLVFDQKRQQSVLVAVGETWLWDGINWSQVQSQDIALARSTTHLVYDASTEHVLLFGGIGLDGTPLNDTWLWDGTTWIEQHPAVSPPPLGGAAIAYNTAYQQVMLFGGITNFDGSSSSSNRVGTFLNETWVWNGTTWIKRNPSITPPERTGTQLMYDEQHQELLLFGGTNLKGYLNDMWRWNGTDWESLHPTTLPSPQTQYSSIFHGQLRQVMLVGEVTEKSTPARWVHTIWFWDGMSWSHSASDSVPSGSIEGLVYDRTRQVVFADVVSGGKPPLGKKSTSSKLPQLPVSTLTSETWVWK